MAKGEITHIEFPADDPERAKRFYAAVAGWEFGEAEGFPDYFMFRNDEGSRRRRRQARRVAPARQLRLYITVDSLEDGVRGGDGERRDGRRAADRHRRRHGPVRGRPRHRGLRGRPAGRPPTAERGTARDRAQAHARTIACASSTPTATSTRTASTTTSSSSLGAARLAGVERILVPGWNVRRRSGRSRSSTATRGSTPPSASTPRRGEGRRAPTGRRSRPGRATSGSSRSGRPGLDSDRMFSPWDAQLDNLRRNLALALATGKPAILHCRSKAGERDAQDALVGGAAARPGSTASRRGRRSGTGRRRVDPQLLGARRLRPRGAGDGPRGRASRASCSGAARRRRPRSRRSSRRERLLVETDAPFLSPPGAPRSRNEPAFVAITARWVAERRGVGEDGLERSATASSPPTTRRSGDRAGSLTGAGHGVAGTTVAALDVAEVEPDRLADGGRDVRREAVDGHRRVGPATSSRRRSSSMTQSTTGSPRGSTTAR